MLWQLHDARLPFPPSRLPLDVIGPLVHLHSRRHRRMDSRILIVKSVIVIRGAPTDISLGISLDNFAGQTRFCLLVVT